MSHPCKYNRSLIPHFEQMLGGSRIKVLDPFAGTGYIFDLLPQYDWTGIEIEEWPNRHPLVQQGNALHLPFEKEYFDAVITSPTYANRLADHHEARDGSKRNTYKHALGHNLHFDNTGQYQWGNDYKVLHHFAWKETYRVLKFGGIFILNIKDHIRKGVRIEVTEWHKSKLIQRGFTFIEEIKVNLKGNGFGTNGKVRVGYESILRFVKE